MVVGDRGRIRYTPAPSDGYFYIDNPARSMDWLGRLGQAAASHVHVRVIDRHGFPISGVQVMGHSGGRAVSGTTNGDGFIILPFEGDPVGTEVSLAVPLPEGQASRNVRTGPHESGQVELFQSIVAVPKPILKLTEGIGLLASVALSALGLSMKPGRTQEFLVGAGSGLFGVSAFSTLYRHVH